MAIQHEHNELFHPKKCAFFKDNLQFRCGEKLLAQPNGRWKRLFCTWHLRLSGDAGNPRGDHFYVQERDIQTAQMMSPDQMPGLPIPAPGSFPFHNHTKLSTKKKKRKEKKERKKKDQPTKQNTNTPPHTNVITFIHYFNFTKLQSGHP